MDIQTIFKNKKVKTDRLVPYGFRREGSDFVYRTEINSQQIRMCVRVRGTDVRATLEDVDSGEPYILHLIADATGTFIGGVRSEYERVLADIAEKCCEPEIFKSDYAKRLIEYLASKYGDKLEFLWKKFEGNAVWRRADTDKWYGVIMAVSKRKLGLDSDETVEIVDFRMQEEELDAIFDGKCYFRGYHMNKRHWCTVCLDGSVTFEEIQRHFDESYRLAVK